MPKIGLFFQISIAPRQTKSLILPESDPASSVVTAGGGVGAGGLGAVSVAAGFDI